MPPTDDGKPRRKASRSSSAIRSAAQSAARGELGSDQQASAEAPPTAPLRGRAPKRADPDWWDSDSPAGPADLGFDPTRTLGDWLEGLIPTEAQGHFINAGKEFAAGVQVTVDHHLGRDKKQAKGGGPIRIEIE